MFKTKGQDNIHQTNIKRGITSHFARMLKILQQKHVQQTEGDEFVYSNNESNNLCNALEAVFLHGLKEPVTQKLSTYVGLATPQDSPGYLNFWSVAEKFTHKDVITQLKSLSQVTTEIGLCRAWIRLALNDGLMESYLHSIIVDTKSLKYFYHSYSYVRDHEQPGILKNYLTGLMSLAFKLSLNSSVLNDWNNSTLQLVSNLKNVPPPVVRPSDSQGPGVVHRATRDRRQKSQDDLEPIVASSKSLSTSSGQDDKGAMFTNIRDVEAIRRINTFKSGSGGVSYTPSEGSSTSLASCPDPSGKMASPSPPPPELLAQSPHLYPRPGSMMSDVIGEACGSPTKQNRTYGSPGKQDRALPGKQSQTYGSHSKQSQTFGSPVKQDQTFGLPGKQSRAYSSDDKEGQDFGIDNTLMADQGSEDVYSADHQTDRRMSSEVSVIEKGISEFTFSPPRPRSRRVTDLDSEILSPHGSVSISSPQNAALFPTKDSSPSSKVSPSVAVTVGVTKESCGISGNSPEVKLEKSPDSDEIYHDIYEAEDDPDATLTAKERTYEDICAGLPPVHLDPMLQDAILKKVLGEMDKQADKDREAKEMQDRQVRHKGDSLPDASPERSKRDVTKDEYVKQLPSSDSESTQVNNLTNVEDLILGKQAEVLMSLDDDRARTISECSFDRSTETVTNEDRVQSFDQTELGVSEQGSGGRGVPIPSESTKVVTVEEEVSTSGRFGNSLSTMMGWSSEIDPRTQVEIQRCDSTEEKSRTESFASMLRSYMPGLSSEPAVTLDQVIEELPCGKDDDYDDNNGSNDGGEDNERNNEDDVDGGTRQTVSSVNSTGDGIQREDSCLDEFEIVQSPTGSLCGQVDVSSSRMIYLFRVPQEHGLSHQNFTCRGCSRPIGIIYGQPRLCSFDKGLYCYECHENQESYIPSSIVFDWDFRKKKVCRENHKFLQDLESQALYDIEQLNPKLYNHVPELKDLKILRERLCYLKSYLFTCSQKMAESLRQKIWPREHLYDRRDLYSITDLLQVQAGTLQRVVKDLVKFSSQHVYTCVLCSQKGYVCEICSNARVIYPFEVETTVRCQTCKAVYHKTCFTEGLPCPKCERWGRRTNSCIDRDHPEDYGMSPVRESILAQHPPNSSSISPYGTP